MQLDTGLLAAIDRNAEEAFALGEWLTDHPEVSGAEKESSAHIIDYLERQGYKVEAPYGGIPYSFRALHPDDDGKKERIAILCEYDALPDLGHACGHSLSCAISVLTAKALREAAPQFPFAVDLIGTPAEETTGGKAVMQENGAFEGYLLAIMAHLQNYHAPQGRHYAANDLYLTFHGVAAHASANPWDGANAFNAAQLFAHASDMLRQHLRPELQFHGIIQQGGAAPNIVPDRVEMDYFLRSPDMAGLALLREKLEKCAEGAAIATGCTYEAVQRYPTYADLFYPTSAEQVFLEIYEAMGVEYTLPEGPSGSSDMGNVDLTVPTIALYVDATDSPVPLHSRDFVDLLRGQRGRKTLREGTCVQASFLLELARRPELLGEIAREHQAYRS